MKSPLDTAPPLVQSSGMPYRTLWYPQPDDAPSLGVCHECDRPFSPSDLHDFDGDGHRYCGDCCGMLGEMLARAQLILEGDVAARQ